MACFACGLILEEHSVVAGSAADHFRRLALSPLEAFDADLAERHYLKLSRLLHPDFQTAATDEVKQLALKNSALLNEAWRTMTDDQLRAEYLLELHAPGSLERHKTLSPEFLMEAMEVSEELDDARSIGCRDTLKRIADTARVEIEERMEGVATQCAATIQRIAREDQREAEGSNLPRPMISPHEWNTEQIAVLLHQARVYRRILNDTEHAR